MNKSHLSFVRRVILPAVLVVGLWVVGINAASGAEPVVPFYFPVPPDPPPLPQPLPGGVVGELKAQWIAPYVVHILNHVSEKSFGEVRWYNLDGTLKREIAGADGKLTLTTVASDGTLQREVLGPPDPGPDSDSETNPRCIIFHYGKGTTVFSTLASWTLRLPDVTGDYCGYYASEDGTTFVRSWSSEPGKIMAEVYVDGKLAATLGPYDYYDSDKPVLGEDGSLAITQWVETATTMQVESPPTMSPTTIPAKRWTPTRVFVFGPGGKKTFEAAYGRPATFKKIVSVAPGGQGIVVEVADGQHAYLTKDGMGKPMQLGGNLRGWVPNSTRALYSSRGHSEDPLEYKLVDWAKGTILWDVKGPKEFGSREYLGPDATIAGDYVLLSGLQAGSDEDLFRAIYALDLATGQLVRKCVNYPMTEDTEAHFARADGQLYLLTDEAFAPLKIEDVKNKQNGWEDAAAK